MENKKLLSLLGLAMKAGKVASGEYATENEVKGHGAYVVIVADDSSNNTKKKFKNMCEFYHVPYYFYASKEILGHAIGKEYRATLAITDSGFAKSMIKHLEQSNNEII